MEFITDRTEADVLLGNAKGRYDYTDLNRVEQDVAELVALADLAGYSFNRTAQNAITTKTDWGRPGAFNANSWPTKSQMQRYLNNVVTLANAFAVGAGLPATMENLTWTDANAIEEALRLVHIRIQGLIDTWKYSGELFAGEEDGL